MEHPEPVRPGPDQESVWDYPRPPRVEPTDELVVVRHRGELVVETRDARRVLETSQPPTYYLPPDDVRRELLSPSTTRTFCEWKGDATYHSLTVNGSTVVDAAWSYDDPFPLFEDIRGWFAFHAQAVDECYVNGERVEPNPGAYYGGWVTSRVVGPFKGEPGSAHW